MYHDYTGKVLHDAHYRDLLEESKGDRLLKAAPPSNEAGQPRWRRRRLATMVTWLLIAAAALSPMLIWIFLEVVAA
jgi:hypothetical protein